MSPFLTLLFGVAMAAVLIFCRIEKNKLLGLSQTQQDEFIGSMATDLSNGQPCLADLFPLRALYKNKTMCSYSYTVTYHQSVMSGAFQHLFCDELS